MILCWVIALSFTAIAPARAASGTRSSAPATTQTATAPDARTAASLKARATGKAVSIASLTTEDESTEANPDGSFTTTDSVFPVRMKSSAGAWENIDPTLVKNPDGTFSTTATPGALTLSGGGTGTLATMSDAQGHFLALGLPASLPAPTVSGPTATYTNVYPGLDLVLTAQPTGSFDEVFVARTPAGAAQAATITFTTSVKGLNLSTEPDGRIDALDATTGALYAAAAPATMWDSATASLGGPSTPNAPSLGAHNATLPAALGPNTLTLTANTSALGADPTYPLYYDPSWSLPYQYNSYLSVDEIQQGCPSYENYDSTSIPPGVGEVTTNTSCAGAYRSYFTVNTSNLSSSDIIESATLQATELSSSIDNCDGGSQTVNIWTTGGINASTSWNNQPPTYSGPYGATSVEDVGNNSSACPGPIPGINVLSPIASIAAANASTWTFMMTGSEVSGSNSLQRFNYNPDILTTYDIAPNTPTTTTTNPTPQTSPGATSQGCGSQTPGYLSKPATGYAVLSAVVSSPVSTAQLRGDFTITDKTANTTTTPESAGYVTGSGTVSVDTPTLIDGHIYTWSVRADDQYNTSAAASPTCTFTVDLTAPTNPAVASTAFPASGSGLATTTYAGQSGSLNLASTDPTPSGGKASGMAGYYYSLDTPIPAIGATLVTNPTIIITPATWGTHTLYAEAVDNAGNTSGQTQYSFFAPFKPGSPTTGVPGNIDGNGVPDLIATTSSGNLVEYPGDTDPAAAPKTISTPTYSPNATTWANYLVAHHGSFTQGTVDDLWAFNTKTHTLYLGKNINNGVFESPGQYTDITKNEITGNDDGGCVVTATGSCADWDSTDWNNLTQVLPVDNTVNDYQGLITVENGQLWYYQGQSNLYYLSNVYNIGSTGWGSVSLVSSSASGSHITLWARDTSTGSTAGDIYAYTLTFDPDGQPVSLGTATSGTTVATGYTSAKYPELASPGNLTNTGNPDLYAIDTTGKLWFYPGTSGAPLAPTHQYDLTQATTGTTNSNGTTPADDTAGTLPAEISATGATFSTTGNPSSTLTFDGQSGYAETTANSVNTAASFTISAWANLTTLGGYSTIAAEAGTQAAGFYLQYNTSWGGWCLNFLASDTANAGGSTLAACTTTAPTLNTWYHLTGVYNATTDTSQLYINGHLAATGSGATPWNSTGNLIIGADQYNATISDHFPGQISDIQTYNTALTTTQISALYAGPQISTTTPTLVGTLTYTNAS